MPRWTLEVSPIIPKMTAEIMAAPPVIGIEIDTQIHAEVVGGDYDFYDGEYDFQPAFEAKQAETANKILLDNIRIEPIEVTRVSNPQGGKTVYIGGIF